MTAIAAPRTRSHRPSRALDAMSAADRAAARLYSRIQYLPGQLAQARARVRMLEAEAARYGMRDL